MIRFLTAAVVVLLAAVAAVVSYRHAYEVVIANGESGFTAVLVPLTIDGLIFASSMVLLDAARRGLPVPWLARWTLGLGILATLAANVMHGWASGVVGAIVAAWPAIALVLSYELLMGLIRRAAVAPGTATAVLDERPVEQVHAPAVPAQVTRPTLVADLPQANDVREDEVQPAYVPESDDPMYPLALSRFLGDVAEGEVPSVRTIKTQMAVGTDRARRLQSYLGQLVQS